ncbi:hypothetical protein H0H92_013845 [Tricholoma furcatifolium]|nr:hypothetical protein H0H92_013845 [Tricholoma furcatifolium]
MNATVTIPPQRVQLQHHPQPEPRIPNWYYGNYHNYNPYQYYDPYRDYDPYKAYNPDRPCRDPIPPSPEPDAFEQKTEPTSFKPCYDAPNPQPSRQPPVLPGKGGVTWGRHSLRHSGADLTFDPLNLAPRPAQWRPDYKAPHSSPKSKRSIFRRRWPGGTLHPLIHYRSSSRHPLAYDLRTNPTTTAIQYLNIPRYGNDIDWYQVASNPPVYELSLYHRKLPWTITVRATQSNGITIGDIFEQIYQNLCIRATREDFYNATLSSSDREEMTTAFHYRQGFEKHEGLQRIDFLGFDVVFLGLASGKNGFLEIMTSSASPP